MVLVPSLLVVMVWGGRAVESSNSSSSAQSGRLVRGWSVRGIREEGKEEESGLG